MQNSKSQLLHWILSLKNHSWKLHNRFSLFLSIPHCKYPFSLDSHYLCFLTTLRVKLEWEAAHLSSTLRNPHGYTILGRNLTLTSSNSHLAIMHQPVRVELNQSAQTLKTPHSGIREKRLREREADSVVCSYVWIIRVWTKSILDLILILWFKN